MPVWFPLRPSRCGARRVSGIWPEAAESESPRNRGFGHMAPGIECWRVVMHSRAAVAPFVAWSRGANIASSRVDGVVSPLVLRITPLCFRSTTAFLIHRRVRRNHEAGPLPPSNSAFSASSAVKYSVVKQREAFGSMRRRRRRFPAAAGGPGRASGRSSAGSASTRRGGR